MIKVKKVTDQDILPPAQSKPGDAGYDLRSAFGWEILPGQQLAIPTGYAWQVPLGWVGLIRPRSGLASKHRIDVRAGVIDSTYREEVKVVQVNEGTEPFRIIQWHRISQLVVVPCMLWPVITVSHWADSVLGPDGFESTGPNRQLAYPRRTGGV